MKNVLAVLLVIACFFALMVGTFTLADWIAKKDCAHRHATPKYTTANHTAYLCVTSDGKIVG
jgi:hypothetical protein